MKKARKEFLNPSAGSMTSQKTNEDFNKKQPDPSNPNENLGMPKIVYDLHSKSKRK